MAIDAQTAAGIGQQATSLIPEDEEETDETKRAVTGALKGGAAGAASGAATGAAIGAAATGPFAPLGAVLGALVGITAGAVTGSKKAKAAKAAQQETGASLAQKEADVVSARNARAKEKVLAQLPAPKEMGQDDEEDDETVSV